MAPLLARSVDWEVGMVEGRPLAFVVASMPWTGFILCASAMHELRTPPPPHTHSVFILYFECWPPVFPGSERAGEFVLFQVTPLT